VIAPDRPKEPTVPPRVAFIHTVGFLVDEFRRQMREQLPAVDCFHVLNESLLQDLLRGAAPALVYRRVVQQVQLAADAGADLIVVTCSSTSPGVDIARQVVEQPVLKIDDPMARQAVQMGPRVVLLCTATSTVAPSSALILAHARELGLSIELGTTVVAPAYEALLAGDRERHDRLVGEAAAALSGQADVIVLAQASLAHLRDRLDAQLPCPVLASPPLLMRELAQRLQPA
jgi:Asp/Glu/hydantoin racemase